MLRIIVGRAHRDLRANLCGHQLQDMLKIGHVHALIGAMELCNEIPHMIAKTGAVRRKIAVEKYGVRKVTASILDAMQLN